MTPLYEANSLRKAYGRETVLDIPHFALAAGENLVLEGPNGSGKSTFLRLLAFLEPPTSGNLRYLPSPLPRQECSLLLQEPFLLHETVFTNVTLGLNLRGIKTNLQERYQEAMHSAGFENPQIFAKRPPHSLSGGEKQRAALAARLILHPRVLLLDEPTAHVDSRSAGHIITALLKAAEEGTTIVCATHDPLLADKLHARRMSMRKPD